MAATLIGRAAWKGNRDSEGNRNYEMTSKIRTSSASDGPLVVMNCPGLPVTGSTYNFGNDLDIWAFCYPDMMVEMIDPKDDNTKTWRVTQKFSTKPLQRCNTLTIQDPLLEPQKIGGSFVRYLKSAFRDMNGIAILTSSWELFRGRDVEFDEAYPTVWIEQNVSDLQLSTFTQYINAVNDSTLWGMNARCVKLSNATWQRRQFGICSYYYTRRFEFDINFDTFDRYLQDEGTKVLNGHHGAPSGSGCTINISTVNNTTVGTITAFTINAGGSGYKASATIILAVTSGNGTGASVTVTTNGSGVVTTAGAPSNGGYNYTAGETGLTTEAPGWTLDQINGADPNPNNPQHFIRYKDANGDCAKTLLDGRGQPAIGRYPGQRLVQKYLAKNLLLLGIPTSL